MVGAGAAQESERLFLLHIGHSAFVQTGEYTEQPILAKVPLRFILCSDPHVAPSCTCRFERSANMQEARPSRAPASSTAANPLLVRPHHPPYSALALPHSLPAWAPTHASDPSRVCPRGLRRTCPTRNGTPSWACACPPPSTPQRPRCRTCCSRRVPYMVPLPGWHCAGAHLRFLVTVVPVRKDRTVHGPCASRVPVGAIGAAAGGGYAHVPGPLPPRPRTPDTASKRCPGRLSAPVRPKACVMLLWVAPCPSPCPPRLGPKRRRCGYKLQGSGRTCLPGSVHSGSDHISPYAPLHAAPAAPTRSPSCLPPRLRFQSLTILLVSHFACSCPALQGWGRVINTGSMHALVASPYKSAYNAAKHGVAGFTKTVALEVGLQLCPHWLALKQCGASRQYVSRDTAR